MSQPDLSLPKPATANMDLPEMYKIATRQNTTWGIDGYQVPKMYHDSAKMAKDKEIEEILKKGKPIPANKKYMTKRGNFLDDELKQLASKTINPALYKITDQWVEMGEIAKKQPKPKPSHRLTYIDAIYQEQKLRPLPAPNLYQKPVKSEKEIKEEIDKWAQRKVKIGALPNYLNEYQYLGSVTPGAGQYNDRLKDSFQWDLELKLKKNVFDKQQPNEWIKKHKEIEKVKMKKDDLKAIHPFPVDYPTFGKLEFDSTGKTVDKNAKNFKYFGSQERFRDMKKTKSTSQLNVPGSGQYNLLSIWWVKIFFKQIKQGKDGKKQKELQNDDKKKQFDYSKINKGIQKSMYYE